MISTQQSFRRPAPSATEKRSVGELLAAVDDDTAWNELVERYGSLVYSIARTFRLDIASTADVTQAVWLRLVENRLRIRDPECLPGWLATTTRREAIRVQRAQRRELPTEQMIEVRDPAVLPVDDMVAAAIDDAALQLEVAAAFQRLSEDHQRLLRLLTAEPKIGYVVIAEIIGRPIGSIGPTRSRCLAELRRHLADMKGERS
ncbi:MAG: sigma-70 family RNA polymerase sigma factor [Nakamurella sp.]